MSSRAHVGDHVLGLDYDGPYDAAVAVRLLGAHAVPGLDRIEVDEAETRFTFLLERPSGPVATTLAWRDGTVEARLAAPASDLSAIEALLRRMLDLDADMDAVSAALGKGEPLSGLLARQPGLRITGYPDGYRAAILTVLGQQVSLAAARTFGARLAAAFGTPGPAGLLRFPTASALAAVPAAEVRQAVGLTGARSVTVITMARACADGLRLGFDADPVRARAELLALPGIGPWTADYLAVRALGDRDAYPAGDLVLRRALGVRTPAEANRAVEHCRPYRAYALFHLWNSTAGW